MHNLDTISHHQNQVKYGQLPYVSENDTNAVTILDQTCQESHKFAERIKSIGDRIFNTFSKNFTGEINDEIHADKKRIKSDNPKECSAAKKVKKQKSN